jgi:hypothetical protein
MERFAPGLESLAVALDTLVEDPTNARLHDDRNIAAIARSLEMYGQQKPIVVRDDGTRIVVLAGNGTMRAARGLGWKRIAVVRTNLDERDARAYAIADNRTAELATWDLDALKDSLRNIEAAGTDLKGDLFFEEADLKALLSIPTSNDAHKKPTRPVRYKVLVECVDERDQAEVIADMERNGRTCKAIMA